MLAMNGLFRTNENENFFPCFAQTHIATTHLYAATFSCMPPLHTSNFCHLCNRTTSNLIAMAALVITSGHQTISS